SSTTCGADRSQDLQGHYDGPADDIIFDILKVDFDIIRQELTQNFRNTKEIFEYAKRFVPEDRKVQQIDTSLLGRGEDLQILQNENTTEQLKTILRIIEQFPNSNIGILVHIKKEVYAVKDYFEQNGYSCKGNNSQGK